MKAAVQSSTNTIARFRESIKNALFFMLRHGQTVLNADDRFRGWSNGPDAELDDKGIKDAKVAGRFLAALPVDITHIFCSDLNRSIHTAAIVGRILGIKDIEKDKRLRPLNVGLYAGKPKSENPIDEYILNPDLSFPYGESIVEFEQRQTQFFDELISFIKQNSDQKPLVIAHVSNLMFWENRRHPREEYLDEKSDIVEPGGVIVITDDDVLPILKENINEKSADKGIS